jgi:AraC-like DNA-binding protein
VIKVEQFNYRKSAEILALSASMTDFTYKKHCHEEYAVGVTLRGIQQFTLDGSFQTSRKNGVMLFNPEQIHDGSSYDRTGIDYVMLYIKPALMAEIMGKQELRFTSPIVYDRELAHCICNLSQAVHNGADESLSSEMLVQSIEKSKDIYSAVAEYGFTDLTHLNRHFKSVFGLTAYEYMSQLA